METREMRTLESPYMNWAKRESAARYNLATSGVPNVLMKDFPFEKEDLELTYGEYGYEPLIEAIAEKSGVKTENVVLSFGTSMANHLARAALIGPGDGHRPIGRRDGERGQTHVAERAVRQMVRKPVNPGHNGPGR